MCIWHLQYLQKNHIRQGTHCFCQSLSCSFRQLLNLLLLKSYYKYQFFRVRNVILSFFYLIICYDFAAWCRSFLVVMLRWISRQSLSICHRNVNITLARNYTKVSFLNACVLVDSFAIIWYLSETYFNSATSTED